MEVGFQWKSVGPGFQPCLVIIEEFLNSCLYFCDYSTSRGRIGFHLNFWPHKFTRQDRKYKEERSGDGEKWSLEMMQRVMSSATLRQDRSTDPSKIFGISKRNMIKLQSVSLHWISIYYSYRYTLYIIHRRMKQWFQSSGPKSGQIKVHFAFHLENQCCRLWGLGWHKTQVAGGPVWNFHTQWLSGEPRHAGVWPLRFLYSLLFFISRQPGHFKTQRRRRQLYCSRYKHNKEPQWPQALSLHTVHYMDMLSVGFVSC